MARQDSCYLHSSQAALIAEIRMNLSVYEKPAGEGVCSVNEDINYFLSSTTKPLIQPELKSPCKKLFYGHARKQGLCSECTCICTRGEVGE